MKLANETFAVPLHVSLEQISAASTLDIAVEAIEIAIKGQGFEKFALLEWQGIHGICSVRHNTPGAWAGSREALTMHPLVRRAMTSPLPFAWDRSFFAAHHAERLWETQALHGLTAGLCTSYGPHDARACVVVTAQPGSAPPQGQELYNVFGPLLLIAGSYYTALQRFSPPVAETVKLRPRELECLHWVLRSKTAWEISKILGISERTVNQHLARARQQLDTTNSSMAAARAVQLQLLPHPHAA